MPIIARCSGCQKHLELNHQYAGKLIKCPLCKTPVRVPGNKADARSRVSPRPMPKPAPAPAKLPRAEPDTELDPPPPPRQPRPSSLTAPTVPPPRVQLPVASPEDEIATAATLPPPDFVFDEGVPEKPQPMAKAPMASRAEQIATAPTMPPPDFVFDSAPVKQSQPMPSTQPVPKAVPKSSFGFDNPAAPVEPELEIIEAELAPPEIEEIPEVVPAEEPEPAVVAPIPRKIRRRRSMPAEEGVVELETHEAHGGCLPEVCIVCGAEASLWRSRTFAWRPWWMSFTPVFVAVAMTKRMRVEAPFCDDHHQHFQWRMIAEYAGIGLAIAFAFCMVLLGIDLVPDDARVVVGAFAFVIGAAFLVALIANAILSQKGIRPKVITDHGITLKNVSPDFIDALDEYRAQEATTGKRRRKWR